MRLFACVCTSVYAQACVSSYVCLSAYLCVCVCVRVWRCFQRMENCLIIDAVAKTLVNCQIIGIVKRSLTILY